MEKKEIDALNIYPNKSSKIDVLTPHKIIVVSVLFAINNKTKSHVPKFVMLRHFRYFSSKST